MPAFSYFAGFAYAFQDWRSLARYGNLIALLPLTMTMYREPLIESQLMGHACRVFLKESPRWLIQKDRGPEAEAVLRQLAAWNRDDHTMGLRPPPRHWALGKRKLGCFLKRKSERGRRRRRTRRGRRGRRRSGTPSSTSSPRPPSSATPSSSPLPGEDGQASALLLGMGRGVGSLPPSSRTGSCSG